MVRTECAGCGGPLTVFADLGETPLADVFEVTAEAAAALPRYRLRAATCDKCGLAQLLDVVDDDLLYGEHYGFRTGGSPSSLAYMKDLAADVIGQMQLKQGPIIEIGCNDGTLMWHLIHAYGGRGIVLGIDPSSPADLQPAYINHAVMRTPFTAETARMSGSAGSAAAVVAVNVAAHVADPHDFLEGVRILLADDGVAVVEFQYFPDLLAGCMFDLIYHEHRFFYSLRTFAALGRQHGLFVRAYQRTASQGGSLRVVLRKDDGPERGSDLNGDQLLVGGLAAGFQRRAEYARARIRETVRGYPGTVHGYAASAKSCTLLNWCGLGVDDLGCVVDATRSKWGRFTPGTGLPVVPPLRPGESQPGAYLLLVSNYLGGVIRREHTAGYRGQFIVPLPLPVIV